MPVIRHPRAAKSCAQRVMAQRGAALLLAMLTVTLVASLAAAALWQQWRSVAVETAERSRVQSGWVLTGALDWARLILREDARSGGADHLSEPWALPLEEARMSTFLAADRNNTAEGDDAFLSGQIFDLQSRLNVTNLVEANKVSEPALKAFTKLFEQLNLPPVELGQMAENLRFALDNSPENLSKTQAYLVPQRVEQLGWLGLTEATVAALKPFVTVLPVRTGLNMNTASAEAIYASVPGLDMAGAQRIVAARGRTHFSTLADAGKVVPEFANLFIDGQHSVSTRFFEVQGRLRLEQNVVMESSVLQRDGLKVTTLSRRRMVDSPETQAVVAARARTPGQ
ncbi:MAG: type II secretion system minor pseudopilin GspK [Burkholderiaceae bacterium]